MRLCLENGLGCGFCLISAEDDGDFMGEESCDCGDLDEEVGSLVEGVTDSVPSAAGE